MDDGVANGPLYSSRAEDPGLGDAIETFVVALAERIDALQDHELAGELDRVTSLSRELGSEAERLGYAELGDCARRLSDAAGSEDRESSHKILVDLTGLAQRVRLGHRGAF